MLKRTVRIILIVLLALALVAGGAGGWYFLFVENITPSVTVEAGGQVSAEDFKIWPNSIEAVFAADEAQPDVSAPGAYPVRIDYYGRSYECNLVVEDTTVPRVTTRSLTRYSQQMPEPADFIESLRDNTQTTVAFSAQPDMTLDGTQTVNLTVTDLGGNVAECSAELTVIVDNEPPVISGVSDRRIYAGFPVDIMEGISVEDNKDASPSLTVDADLLDQETAGEYILTYVAGDANGNYSAKAARFTVVEDKEAPMIWGVNPLSMYQGGTVTYRAGIRVVDDQDPAPVLKIDSSKVDLSVPGTYDVVYTATDEAGNENSIATTITITARANTYVEEDVIYEKADELLKKIIKEDMSVREQVEAIYTWVRSNCTYNGYSDKTDRLQAAYKMMTRRAGDCFDYFAICSVFFDRLGIPNIAVRRSPNSVRPTKHYWNMVSIDGGENYYHVDVSPGEGFSRRMCLVTDAVLQQISNITPGYYTVDEGLYPATPTEALP